MKFRISSGSSASHLLLAVLLFVGTSIVGFGVQAVSAASPTSHAHATWARGQLGLVRYIFHGLTVTPPHKKHTRGKVRMPLFGQYGVRTGTNQKASIGFRDGTLVHLNQRTDAILASGSSTKMKSGELQEVLTPGTKHSIVTASALGAASGTIFDVKIVKNRVTWTVLEGALKVQSKRGSVLVKTNQQSTVTGNQKPTTPVQVNAAAITNWSKVIPSTATPQKNVALDANGGRVADYSSQSSDAKWSAANLIDGSLSFGWSTATGQVANQWVKIGFTANQAHNIGAVAIDAEATQGHAATNALKDFQIRVSTTGLEDADFTTVFSGTAKQQSGLQRFVFSNPVSARYVELVAVNNYGGTDAIDVAEFEAVAYGEPLVLPVPVYSSQRCPDSQDGCMQALLDLINAARTQNKLAPVILNVSQSMGKGACVGSLGHSMAMAEADTLFNTDPTISTTASFPQDICLHNPAPGENVGNEATGNVLSDLQAAHAAMLAQPHDATTCKAQPNAACNILSPDFNQVGIGIYTVKGTTWITEDFLE